MSCMTLNTGSGSLGIGTVVLILLAASVAMPLHPVARQAVHVAIPVTVVLLCLRLFGVI